MTLRKFYLIYNEYLDYNGLRKTERWVAYVIGNIVCIVIICNTDRGSDKEIYQMGYITGGV